MTLVRCIAMVPPLACTSTVPDSASVADTGECASGPISEYCDQRPEGVCPTMEEVEAACAEEHDGPGYGFWHECEGDSRFNCDADEPPAARYYFDHSGTLVGVEYADGRSVCGDEDYRLFGERLHCL